jgi:hypothetical protein
MEKKGMLVDAWAAVKSSSVVSGCVAVWFIVFSLRRHNMIGRNELKANRWVTEGRDRLQRRELKAPVGHKRWGRKAGASPAATI